MLPIVFLTGDPDPELQYEVLDSGRRRLPQQTDPSAPPDCRRIQPHPAHASAPAAQQALANDNRTHPENGLATRTYLLQLINASLQDNAQGGLFFIEIASALGLRERYGYAAFVERLMGDAGKRLSQLALPHPLARLNDNSFLMLARDLDDERDLEQQAKNLRNGLAQHAFLVLASETVHLRSSVATPHCGAQFEDAGSALEATERKRPARPSATGCIAAYVPAASVNEEERITFVDGQLELAYQPIVAVAGNEQAQYQVLLRLRQPDGTLLSAGQVVPAAETAGVIANLDQQVKEHDTGPAAQYRNATPSMRLFVSQSPRTLRARSILAVGCWTPSRGHGVEGSSLIIDLRLGDALIHTVTLQDFCKSSCPPACSSA